MDAKTIIASIVLGIAGNLCTDYVRKYYAYLSESFRKNRILLLRKHLVEMSDLYSKRSSLYRWLGNRLLTCAFTILIVFVFLITAVVLDTYKLAEPNSHTFAQVLFFLGFYLLVGCFSIVLDIMKTVKRLGSPVYKEKIESEISNLERSFYP